MYALVALGIVIIYLFPRLTTIIPSTLVAVVVVTAIAIIGNLDIRSIGDMGGITAALPVFHIPDVAYNIETLIIVLPYSVSLAIVGLSETLPTSKVIDEMTDSEGDRNRECRGLGMANIVSGFFSGTCGCAMIGQAIVNVNSGGRGRLSNFVSGSFLMVLIFLLNDLMVQIPLAALVAVMITVSVSTFDWAALRRLHRMPRSDAFVIIIVVGVVVATNNLAFGVVLGVAFTAIFHALHGSKLDISVQKNGDVMVYEVYGELFFASVEAFHHALDFHNNARVVILDLENACVLDESAATAVYNAITRFENNGNQIQIRGIEHRSCRLLWQMYGGRGKGEAFSS